MEFLERIASEWAHPLLDEPLLDAFRFPRPTPFVRSIVASTLRTRAALIRMWPLRRRRLRTELPRPTYPHGDAIEDVGPAEGRTSDVIPSGPDRL